MTLDELTPHLPPEFTPAERLRCHAFYSELIQLTAIEAAVLLTMQHSAIERLTKLLEADTKQKQASLIVTAANNGGVIRPRLN